MGRKNIERNEERNKEAGIEGKQNLKVGSSKETRPQFGDFYQTTVICIIMSKSP